MKFLLDTHTFLWFIEGSPQLSTKAPKLIDTRTNRSYLSVASLWEIAIKISLGKLQLSRPFEVLIPRELGRRNLTRLDITVEHTAQVSKLPFHHRDPFDRLLIAQALVEQLPIVSADVSFDAYGVTRLW